MQARPSSLFRPDFVRLLALQPVGGFAICVFYLLPKFLTAELHATPSEVGLVSAAFGAASVLSVPVVGYFVDRGATRGLIAGATLLLTITAFAFVGVTQVGGLVLALRGAQGFAWAIMFTGGLILTARLAPPSRLAEAIGYYGCANLAMNAVAPALAEGVAETWGWKVVFAFAGAAGLAGCILARGLPAVSAPSPGARTSTWALLRRARTARMMAVVLLWGNAFGVMFTFYQPFALQLGIEQVRSFFLAYTAAALFARMGTGTLPDRLGRFRVAVGSLALYGAVVLATQYLRPGWLAPLGGVFGLAHGLFFPAYTALTVQGVRVDEQGKLMALINASFNTGFALSGVAFGALAQRAGYPSVFLVAGFATFGGVAVLLIGERRGDRGGGPPASDRTEERLIAAR